MNKPHVRPDVQAFLDQMKANPFPPMSDELVAKMRKMPLDAMPSFDLPVGELGEIRDLSMPGPGSEIALRLFDTRAAREPSPVVVYYHGGGFAVGSIDSHAGLCAEISRVLDLPVVSVEYRLAPENPWPAAPDDCEAAARWIADHPEAFGRAFTGLVLAGDSAGGNLAAVTTIALRDEPAALPVVLQFAIYPVTDSVHQHESRSLFSSDYFLEKADIDYFDRAYASEKLHWRASPLHADLSNLPPSVVVTAGLDPLRDEGRAYAEKLRTAGVHVAHYEADGTIHGFATFRLHIPSARDDLAQALEIVDSMIAGAIG